MRRLLISVGCLLGAAAVQASNRHISNIQSVDSLVLERKLDTHVGGFSTSGRPLIANLLDLAYEYELPMGLEYVDRTSLTRPINLEFHDQSVREILTAIILQFPEYRVSFADGLVDIYSPTARDDPSDLLNKIIGNFAVTELDTHRADMELFCALAREIVPPSGCGGSIAVGQWGALRVTVHLQRAKVYEILNAIVARNGKAIWTVIAAPEKLSTIPTGGLWHIYPLEQPFKVGVLEQLTSMRSYLASCGWASLICKFCPPYTSRSEKLSFRSSWRRFF